MAEFDTSMDYYSILSVAPTATVAEIKQAYRAAAKQFHPDAGGDAAEMALISEAHHVLANPPVRQEYDDARRLAADAQLMPRIPESQANTLVIDMSAITRAEELRARAAHAQMRRENWARQSGTSLLSGSMLWLAGSVGLGILLSAALVGKALLIWTAINAGIITVGGFGIVAIIWPDQRLALLDLSPYLRIYPNRSWWTRLGIVVAVAILGSLGLTVYVSHLSSFGPM